MIAVFHGAIFKKKTCSTMMILHSEVILSVLFISLFPLKICFLSSEASPADMFDVKTCQRNFAEHYQKTAKVPTTAWSSAAQVDLEQIYTRLSWVKQEQTTAGPSQKELNHYTEIFTGKTKSGAEAKRILVQGETGIGKSTFVKKLLVDWSNLEEAKMDEERKDALRKFELVVSINLKDVSKCQTLKEVVSGSRLFPEDEEKSVDDLLCYMRTNQDKVLLVFDGYDEYRTGSEAEKRYGNRINSPIFKIFHANILRDCTVLVTTRSSRADEIRGPADIEAEITGFNIFDRKEFMRKMLHSETEVDDLLTFLSSSGMHDLARVPLLSLFFCLLWKKEKQKLVELTKRKAKLYQAIVEHILLHSHRRHSSSTASKINETDYEILAEIGKVALAGLLKGDLMFEFGQLPSKVRGKEGVIVGLFQLSEYGPSLEPMEMVSFIHKSIQEYLAAWYLVYSCVPKGNLGEVEQDGTTLEDCEVLENVFQFVCGLSDEGAIKVLEHLKSVRISDPTLDLSKTIPDVETETDAPLCDVTDRHERFSYLLYDSFRGVQSKAKLLSHFLDCTGGVILVSRDMLLSELLPDVNVFIKLARNLAFIPWEILFDNFHLNCEDSVTYKSLAFLNRLKSPVRVTESSDVLEVEDLIRKLQPIRYRSILWLRNDQFQFYITELSLKCDDHARPFTESTSISALPDTASLQRSCLKFLTFLFFRNLSDQTVKAFGGVIRSCEHLYMIDAVGGEESMCYLLNQVPNPSKCSVTISTCFVHPDITVDPASEGAVQLASLLPRFKNIITLHLDVRDCCATALNTLVTGITHKTVKNLILSGIKLTPAAAEALGRSLPKMSSLQVLQFYGIDGSVLQAEEMKALFGRFNKTLSFSNLTFISFSEINCLAQFNESFHFFPNLRGLHLENINLNEHDLCVLLESWSFIRNLTELHVWGNQPGRVHCDTRGIEKSLLLGGVKLTSTVAMTLGRVLPEMSSLQVLGLYKMDGSILQAEEMKALFGRFNKTLPLCQLTFSSFDEISCLAPLNQRLCFFPNLRALHLEKVNLNEHDLCGLLKSWSFIYNLTELHVRGDQPGRVHCYPLGIEKSLILGGVNLTSAVATTLGRILPEMSSLQVLELYGMDGSILQAEEMEALFGRFNKTLPLPLPLTLPLYQLTLSSFDEISCLAPLNQSLRFFSNLRVLHLEKLNINDHDLCGLLENWNFFRNLTELRVLGGNQPGRIYCHTFGTSERLTLDGVNLTSAVATALGRILPEMSSLQTLKLTGVDGSILHTKELEALFGKLHKPLLLQELDITDYDMRGSLAPLIKSLRFFPSVRNLEVNKLNMDEDDQCGLLESLKFIPDLTSMEVQSRSWFLGDCGTPRLTLTSHNFTLGTSKNLYLLGISLTPATTASLGRSLPEMSSLETLKLAGHQDGRILQAEVIEALFGGFSKIMRLSDLKVFPGLNVTGSIAPLTNVFCFLPNLARLCLVGLSMDEHNMYGLLESLQFTPKLMELTVCHGRVGRAHSSTTITNPVSGFTHEALRKLKLIDIDVTPAVAAMLGRFLPEMLSLQNLSLQDVQFPEDVEGMEALFGGFNKKLPLVELFLSNSGFSFKSCPLGPAAKSFRFFPNLEQLHLKGFVMDELNLCALLESLRFIPNLKELNVKGGSPRHMQLFPMRVYTMPSITHKTLEQLKPDEVSLTPVAAPLVGRSLPEMSSQETDELTGVDGSISQAEEMKAFFGGFRTLRNSSLRVCLTTFCKGFHALPNLKTSKLERLSLSELGLCALLESLRFIPSVRELSVKSNRYDQGHAHRFTDNMQDRFSSFTLEDRERLHLIGINLTSAAATALGRSLPEMSSLQVLQLTGVNGSILQAEEIEALFGGFNKTLPLYKFTFTGFSVRGRLAPLIKSLQFFASLKELKLEEFTIDEHDQCGLLKSFGFIRNLGKLSVRVFGENFRYRPSGFKAFVSHAPGLVILNGLNLTLAVAKELGQLLREMSSLQDLELEGKGSTLGAEEMKALFGRLGRTMPLYGLTVFDFSVGGSFAPLNESFRLFPNLTLLLLEMLNMGEHDLHGLLESFQFIPNLQKLSLSGNPLGHAVTSIVPHVINLKKLQYLWIGNTSHSEEDLIYVRDSVQQARPDIQVEDTAVFMKSLITPLVY